MDGETYHFRRSAVEQIPVKPLSDAGVAVALILLTYRSGQVELDRLMLHPRRADPLPNGLAGFNTVTPEGLRHLRACLEFLAHRFSRPDRAHGRVVNYIVGNEVTAHWHWYNVGEMPRDEFVAEYLRAVRLVHAAVRKASTSARVYLSFDHHWNLTYQDKPLRAIAGRALLDEFARQARLGGDFDWHLEQHPYPENLGNPRVWLDKTAPATPDAPRITFKNIEVLTAYLGRPELVYRGQPRRLILSEQGFHSDGTPGGDLAQAAAYCYAWQKVDRLEGVDAFILHRHVDHAHEGGLNLGLWRRESTSVATPSTRRPIYDVFLNADTPRRDEAFRFALPIIGITNWDQVLTR